MNINVIHKRIDEHSFCIGVIGLGYVGLPLLRAFWSVGFSVLGFDVDERKLNKLRRGENYLRHLGDDLVSQMTATDRFDTTSDFDRLSEADAIIICVPTPLGPHREPDLSYVLQTTDEIARRLRPGQVIVLESTTYPGTTRQDVLPLLERTALRCGKDFYLAFSPEREDPGRQDFETATIPKLVGGIDDSSGAIATALYEKAIRNVIRVSSAEVAEAAKILENIYRAVNIALVNELKVVFSAMDIDIWRVIDAAKTKPFGFQAFYPGPGLGGHCIPIDPFYLSWKAKEYNLPARFIELAGEINHQMPEYVINRVCMALNNCGKTIKNSRILVLGLAYKPDVSDVRESPSFALIRKLRQLGAHVEYNDPHVPRSHDMRHYPDLPPMVSVGIDAEALRLYDCVIVATNHSAYDYKMIAENASVIVDTRNAIDDSWPGVLEKLTKA